MIYDDDQQLNDELTQELIEREENPALEYLERIARDGIVEF